MKFVFATTCVLIFLCVLLTGKTVKSTPTTSYQNNSMATLNVTTTQGVASTTVMTTTAKPKSIKLSYKFIQDNYCRKYCVVKRWLKCAYENGFFKNICLVCRYVIRCSSVNPFGWR